MTIIVYRDGVLAADSLTISGDRGTGHTTKLVRTPHGAIGGAAGTAAATHRFREWFTRGQGKFVPASDDFGALMIDAAGTVTRMDKDGTIYPAPDADYHIEGCAEDIAAGALEHGATAEEAVRIACRLHTACGGSVQVLQLKETTDENDT